MDTDDLSKEAYKAISSTAESFHHDLTLQFGLLSYHCENENEYLENCKKLINEWIKDKNSAINNIFFDDAPTQSSFKIILQKILDNIVEIEKIPFESREFEN